MSTTTTEIKDMIEDIGTAQEAWQKRESQRLDRVEAAINRPNFGPPDGKALGGTPEQREHAETFRAWLRSPTSQRLRSELETRDVETGTPGSGGYGVPELIGAQITRRLKEMNPLRRFCRVEEVSSSDFKLLVDMNNASTAWAGETGARNATDTPELEEVAPTFGTLYSYVKATEESVLDIRFDVGRWLIDTVSEEQAFAEGLAFISGNGTDKPTGILNGSKVATADSDSPARAFGAIEYVPTGVAGGFPGDPNDSPPGDPVGILLDALFALAPRYRANPSTAWCMNNRTAKVIAGWRDGDGRHLWQPGMQAGQPDRLLGFPVILAESWPGIAADAHPVAIAAWNRAYAICDQGGFRITFDDNISTPGYHKWYLRRRVGGKLLDDRAVKLIKCATS